jgi:hypothetical protein
VAFVFLCISILLWLVRPQDWLPIISGMGLMTYTMLGALVGLWMRPAGIRLRHLWMSPMDLCVALYLLWILWVTGDYTNTAKELVSYVGFYLVAALALNTQRRLAVFLGCWAAGYAGVAILASSTLFGTELVAGSADLTGGFLGRLCLNTWIFNNPNSLGHGMAASIAVLYLWLIWRRGVFSRFVGLGLISLAVWVLYETQSKGAYLAGAGACFICFLFGKSLPVQAFSVASMFTAGMGALRLLPRMESLHADDEGIMGRLAIWQMAYHAMTDSFFGEGWKKFQAWIMAPELGLIRKATHGSYVNVGADLGYSGLLLYVGILYVGAKTLYRVRLHPDDLSMQRSQRMLLALLSAYAVSAWIIDRAYHMDFFILAGSLAAFHRLVTATDAERGVDEVFLQGADHPEKAADDEPMLAQEEQAMEEPEEGEPLAYARLNNLSVELWPQSLQPLGALGLSWKRLAIADALMMAGLTYLVIELWTRFMNGFILI